VLFNFQVTWVAHYLLGPEQTDLFTDTIHFGLR
jgi:hypothetical protein